MKVLRAAAALLGTVAFMGGIIVAQVDYQQSWNEGALVRTPRAEVSEAFWAVPDWLHQPCTSMKMTIG
jgi:hypothetical protein